MTNIIKKIQEINLEIENLTEQSEWEKVEREIIIRHQILTQYFVENKPTLDQSILLRIKSEIEMSDEKTKNIMDQQKQSTIESSINLRNSYKAANEYRKTNNATSNS